MSAYFNTQVAINIDSISVDDLISRSYFGGLSSDARATLLACDIEISTDDLIAAGQAGLGFDMMCAEAA